MLLRALRLVEARGAAVPDAPLALEARRPKFVAVVRRREGGDQQSHDCTKKSCERAADCEDSLAEAVEILAMHETSIRTYKADYPTGRARAPHRRPPKVFFWFERDLISVSGTGWRRRWLVRGL